MKGFLRYWNQDRRNPPTQSYPNSRKVTLQLFSAVLNIDSNDGFKPQNYKTGVERHARSRLHLKLKAAFE